MKKNVNIDIEYAWLKKMPGFSKYYFGLFFNINNIEYLGGVLVYRYKNNLEHKFYYLEDYNGEYDLETDLYIKPKEHAAR